MKKNLLILIICFTVLGCGAEESANSAKKDDGGASSEVVGEVVAGSETLSAADQLAEQNECSLPSGEVISEKFVFKGGKNKKFSYNSAGNIAEVLKFFENKPWVLEVKQMGTHENKIFQIVSKDYDVSLIQEDGSDVTEVTYQCRG